MIIKQSSIYNPLLFALTLIIVDFYYFPTSFLFLPIGNTKLYMAVSGLLLIAFGLPNKQHAVVGNSLFTLSVLASMVSLASISSMTINHTSDNTYVSYIVSVYVWLSAAYVIDSWVRQVYGKASVFRICDFIIWVCVIQCVVALLVVYNDTLQRFVDGITDTVWLQSVNRMYGIGASLDTAGVHFSLALIMIIYILGERANDISYKSMFFYVLAFFIIAIIGNMVARVTTIGMILSLLYFIYKSGLYKLQIVPEQRKVCIVLLLVLVVAVPVVAYFYMTNDVFCQNIRFGFEGFFSLIEKGEWDVASNNTLKSMIIFPETIKTWLMGDGYIINPKDDPFYIGPITPGYYMNTDIGYLRFVFYFGLLGLLAFSAFIIYMTRICITKHYKHKSLLLLFLLTNFIVWFKVSTDLFFIFALLFFADKDEDSENDRTLSAKMGL